MKQFEYLYFAIYTHYSKRSYFPDHPAVRLQAMFLLSISVGGWILLGQATYLQLREAQRSLEDAYNRLISARYNTKLAETELLRLKGDLVR